MTLRHVFGLFVSAAALLSLAAYAFTWVETSISLSHVWPFFLGTALVFISGAVSGHVIKPHYKIDRVLQIPRLKPFFTDREYQSIWAVFAFMLVAFLIAMLQLSTGSDATRCTLQAFTSGWFGFLYTDALILLRARFPGQSAAAANDA
jgi:hypothetical protein